MTKRIELTKSDFDCTDSGGIIIKVKGNLQQEEELRTQILQDQEKAKRLDEAINEQEILVKELEPKTEFYPAYNTALNILLKFQEIRDGDKK